MDDTWIPAIDDDRLVSASLICSPVLEKDSIPPLLFNFKVNTLLTKEKYNELTSNLNHFVVVSIEIPLLD